RPPPAPLDVNKVAVFPLAEHGLPASAAGAGYDIAIIITTAFDQAAPLKWIDVRPWLAEPERTDPDLITPDGASRIARSRGARYYVSGLVRGGDAPSVHVRLFDALADTLVTQRSSPQQSQGASLTSLGLMATKDLLAAWLDPGRAIDLSPIEDRHTDAIAFWILGERAFRRARFGEALAAYRRALEHDSALALAAVKGAQAANWKSEYGLALELAEWAVQQGGILPAKYERLARGMRAYFAGQPDTAIHWMQRALAEDPDWAEAHGMLGEVYFHLVPITSRPINELAQEAFERAVSYDSASSEPIFHLAEFAILAGDLPRARTLVDRMRRDSADIEFREQLRLMLRCAESRTPDDAWELAMPEETIHAFRAAESLAVGALQAECAERGLSMVLGTTESAGQRWGAFLGLQGILASQGRVSELLVLADSIPPEFGQAGTEAGRRLLILDALAGVDVGDRAAMAAIGIADVAGGLERITRPSNLWLLGWWYASRGELESLRGAHQRLGVVADSLDRASVWEYARSLDALLALSQGDTATALGLLESIVPVAGRDLLSWDFAAPHAVDRMLLARIRLAREEWEQAIAIASVFDHPTPTVYLPFVAASLALRHQAAVQAGDRSRRLGYRWRLEALGRQDLLTRN
ncbi:MAG: hypothetical protein JSW71_06520, partial [Gemmatimonadota bacterium]